MKKSTFTTLPPAPKLKNMFCLALVVMASMQLVAQTNINMPHNTGPASYTVTAPSYYNFFDSGGSASNYSNGSGVNSVVTFAPSNPATKRVKVQFCSLTVESGWDALYIFNGPSTASPLISAGTPATTGGFPAGGWNSSNSPGTQFSTDASGALTFQFRSDASVNNTGWSAVVTEESIVPPSTPPPTDIFIARTAPNAIAKFDPNTSGLNLSHVLSSGTVTGVAVDEANGKLYFTRAQNNAIGVANLNGSGINENLITGQQKPYGITLDPTNQKIYWANTGNNQIMRANLDGSSVTSILTVADGTLYDVAVSPNTNQLFWCARNHNMIGVADLAGGSPVPNFIDCGAAASGIFGLGIDGPGGKLFWTNFDAETIGSANVNGTGINTALVSGCPGPRDVAVDSGSDQIYWTNGNSIGTATVDGANANQSFITNIVKIWGIDLIQSIDLCP